jgi:hypothetical protein
MVLLAWSPAAAEPALPWLAQGVCEASLVAESNISIREEGDPLSLAPDIACGMPAGLTLGVVHSHRGLSRVDSGNGLCLTEEGCSRPYDGGALDLRKSMRGGRLVRVAARLRLVARSLEPFKPSARIGGLVRIGRGRLWLLADPHLSLGLAAQDQGNRDFVALPLTGQLEIGRRVVLELITGVRGEIDGFDEAFLIPFGLGIVVRPVRDLDIGLEAAFPRLLGPQNNFKHRHAALFVTVRFATGPPPPGGGSYMGR